MGKLISVENIEYEKVLMDKDLTFYVPDECKNTEEKIFNELKLSDYTVVRPTINVNVKGDIINKEINEKNYLRVKSLINKDKDIIKRDKINFKVKVTREYIIGGEIDYSKYNNKEELLGIITDDMKTIFRENNIDDDFGLYPDDYVDAVNVTLNEKEYCKYNDIDINDLADRYFGETYSKENNDSKSVLCFKKDSNYLENVIKYRLRLPDKNNIYTIEDDERVYMMSYCDFIIIKEKLNKIFKVVYNDNNCVAQIYYYDK